jgi:hypothetical protein
MELWDKFVDLTLQDFSFLERDFQFVRKEEEPPFVFYQSDKIEVGIYYGIERGHHELGLRIVKAGNDSRKSPSIGIGAIMALSSWQEAEKYRSPFPKTEEELAIEVAALAGKLKRYGEKILRCDQEQFERLDRLRQERIDEINERAHLNLPKRRFRR